MKKYEPKKRIISGTGCALADFLYNKISFDSPGFRKYMAKQSGDSGIIASIAWQPDKKGTGRLDLTEVISWGVASGGHICYVTGRTYFDKYKGEKPEKVSELQREYIKQTSYCMSTIQT